MFKNLCFFLLPLLLISCQRKVKFNPPPDEVKDTQLIRLEKKSNIKSFKGLYIFGNEVSTFRDCATGKVYWLTDSTNRLTKLYNSTQKTLSYPYESVYAELSGYLKGKSNIGYAEEYENELIVKDIIKLQPKDFRTECYNYEFIGLGNEPFWSVEVMPDEEKIVLKDVAEGKVYQFPCSSAVTEDEIIHYRAKSFDGKSKIDFQIKKQPCSDGMSDRRYRYSATVIINNKTLKGCAIKKGDKL